MGADSRTGNSQYTLTMKDPKVFRADLAEDPIVLGISGSHRLLAIARSVKFPPIEGDLIPWIEQHVVDVLREKLKSTGYLKKKDEVEEVGSRSTILVGAKGRIFSVWEDFSVVEQSDPYMAIGSGMYFALGALAYMHATRPRSLSGSEPILAALKAAAKHSAFVGEPFHVISTSERT